VPEEKIAKVQTGMAIEEVINLLGEPAKVWQRSLGGPDTDIIFLYRGQTANHWIIFTSLGGITLVTKEQPVTGDEGPEGFREYQIVAGNGSIAFRPK
jgi:hypothetical protein